MEAVVLAGGLGTRLRGRVPDIPKAMAPVADRPFLAWLLDDLIDAGFDRAILSVGHLGDMIRSSFGGTYRSLELTYVVEASPLGTGGALRNALASAGSSDMPIWVMNGDSIAKLSHAKMWALHEKQRANPLAITMAVVGARNAARYGLLEVHAGRVTHLRPAGDARPGPINAGSYLVHRKIFEAWNLPVAFSFETDFLARFTHRLEIAGFETDGWFIDIGVPADYDRAQIELPAALSSRPRPMVKDP
jgi:D-glycero-alpha-D-manno-heptose 1-phosphate guanylyltransferase